MRLVFRPLAPRELDAELIVLSVSVGLFALLGTWLRVGLPWPHCLFLSLTGYPCLTCGATRASIQLVHGHLWQAFLWNPLVLSVLVAIAFFDLYAGIAFVFRTRRLRGIFSPVEKRAVRWTILVLAAANWGYLLLHAKNYG